MSHHAEFVPATSTDRLLAYVVDVFILTLPFGAIAIFTDESSPLQHYLAATYAKVFLVLFFCRDVFGRSPGKALFGLSILRSPRMDRKPNVLVLFARNLPLLLGPVEVLVLLFHPNGKRLGDLLSASAVVKRRRNSTIVHKAEPLADVIDDASGAVTCLSCGVIIPDGRNTCPHCGWSYKPSK